MFEYGDFEARRAERLARRRARLEREARMERIIAPIKYAAQIVVAFALLYAYLFFGCLWASM